LPSLRSEPRAELAATPVRGVTVTRGAPQTTPTSVPESLARTNYNQKPSESSVSCIQCQTHGDTPQTPRPTIKGYGLGVALGPPPALLDVLYPSVIMGTPLHKKNHSTSMRCRISSTSCCFSFLGGHSLNPGHTARNAGGKGTIQSQSLSTVPVMALFRPWNAVLLPFTLHVSEKRSNLMKKLPNTREGGHEATNKVASMTTLHE
jgi:hypothetical protein